ncbi:MAG: alkaline phosphatase [Paludibacter sp.]|nr:alkaline phosphatase [Paludibacter sp.]
MNFRNSCFVFLILLLSFIASGKTPKYVFYFIGDGMGFNHITATSFYQSDDISDLSDKLVFTHFPVTGIVNTRSATHYITDSSAGGTALASGHKANNRSVGLNAKNEPVFSVVHKAKKNNWMTGIVTSTSVDDATPSSFYAHAENRNMYYEIGKQAANSSINFLGGAGFKSYTNPQNQHDPHLLTYFAAAGYVVYKGFSQYINEIKYDQPVVLISKRDYPGTALPYAIDRTPEDLTLEQLTSTAIDYFKNNKARRFMLVVEGGRIDHASHPNDGAAAITELIDMEKSIRLAYDFYLKHPKETLILLTSDHETGGLALGIEGTVLNLQVLSNQKASLGKLSGLINELHVEYPAGVSWNHVIELLKEQMGFWNEIPISKGDEVKLKTSYEDTFVTKTSKKIKTSYSVDEPLAKLAVEIINKHANLGWTTNNHSGAAVPVFAIGAGADEFTGMMENTDIPKKLEKICRLK